jgi:hypothetical protein
MSKTGRYPKLAIIVFRKLDSDPPSKSGRGLANVHRYIEYGSPHHSDKLSLWLTDLIVQASQDTFCGSAVVILYEVYVKSCN